MSRLAAVMVTAAMAATYTLVVYHAGKESGRKGCEATYQRAAEAQRQEDSDAVGRVEAEAEKRQKVLVVDREVVKTVVDPTGCLDLAPPADLAERVRNARARAAGD